MKKSARFLTAILLVISMLIPGTVAFGYDVGDTIQWKYVEEYDGETTASYCYPIYKGEIEVGETTHKSLGNSNEAAFLFTADKAGYYLIGSDNSDVYVSEKITDGKPEGFKDCFSGYDYSELFCTYLEAYYFEAGEQEYIRFVNYSSDSNSDSVTINYAGEIKDIEFRRDETYLIGSDIDFYDEEDPTVDECNGWVYVDGCDGWIYCDVNISFTDYDSSLYDDDCMGFKSQESLKHGENTITLCVGNFEKEVKVNCFDATLYVSDIKKNDDTIYEDYSGCYHTNDSAYTVTFADGTSKVVNESEIFEFNGVYFSVNYSDWRCSYDRDSDDYTIRYEHSLYYSYDSDTEYYDFDFCKSFEQSATVKYYGRLKNFSIMISDVRNCFRWFFDYLFDGDLTGALRQLIYILEVINDYRNYVN